MTQRSEAALGKVYNQPTASPSFIELCGFIAVRQAQDSEEVVRQLLLHCFVLANETRFFRSNDFAAVLLSRFGLMLSPGRLQSAIDKLVNAHQLERDQSGEVRLTVASAGELASRNEDARSLESRVRASWLSDVALAYPSLPPDLAWKILTDTLRQLFRRHGLQTLSYLDTNLGIADEDDRGIRQLVKEACSGHGNEITRSEMEAAVLAFFAGAGSNADRATLISRFADSTVSYLSLTIPPEVATRLRAKLYPLDVFLDTNILFGLVGLAEPETADAARELEHAIRRNKLPLDLRFHEDTENELRRTFDGLASNLRSRVWPPAVSAAAAKSRQINTVTRLYHERNAEVPLSAESFLQPYAHVDVLIREHGGTPYRESRDVFGQTLFDLQHDIEAFLAQRNREKPYEAIIHDATLLLTVRSKRVEAHSSLEARAILLTNDVMLHLFEVHCAKKEKRQPCTLLLRQLLQLLRPFVAATDDFDRSFAETFAASEFRAMSNSKTAAATAKLLEIMAAYRDVSEETASALLANDMLLGNMQATHDQREMELMVESAVAIENAALQTERDALAARLQRVEGSMSSAVSEVRQALEIEHEQEKQALVRANEELAREREMVAQSAAAKEQALAEKATELETKAAVVADLQRRLDDEHRARELAEREADTVEASLQSARSDLELAKEARLKGKARLRLAIAMAVLAIAIGVTETFLANGNLTWLAEHPQSLGLRATGYALLGCLLIGTLRSDLRRGAWWTAAIAFTAVLFQLLGGRSQTS